MLVDDVPESALTQHVACAGHFEVDGRGVAGECQTCLSHEGQRLRHVLEDVAATDQSTSCEAWLLEKASGITRTPGAGAGSPR